MHYSYYPFRNSLDELDHTDLLLLRDVSEGWYIDYKRQGLKVADTAKHLSAFANQYGGWLIIGVTETVDGTRSADEFVGIQNSDLEKVCTSIREASSAHVNPEVHYEEKIIKGPIEEIGLEADRSIVIIGIPTSYNTPHIHSSGRVYKRIADQSKPKEETDRHQLDKMWERSNTHREKVIKNLTSLPVLSELQEKSAWLHAFIKQSDFENVPDRYLKYNEFKSIVQLQGDKKTPCFAPLDSTTTTVDGFSARQTQRNNPTLSTMGLRWYRNGTIRLDIPINSYDAFSFAEQFKSNPRALKFLERLTKDINEEHLKNVKILDYSYLLTCLMSLSGAAVHMLGKIGDNRTTYTCYSLRNVTHTIPFFDNDKYLERVELDGIPLTVDDIIRSPESPSETNMPIIDIDLNSIDFGDVSQTTDAIVKLASAIGIRVLIAVGAMIDPDNHSDFQDFFQLRLSTEIKQ